jgi:glycerol kinase
LNDKVWLDTRTKATVDHYLESHSKDALQKICGLPISTYFSGVKLRWLLDNVPKVQQALKENRLLFGTVDSWLLYKLCKGNPHITDVSNASRTMLMSLKELKWDPELLNFFDIPASILPEIRSSSEVYGEINDGPLKGTPISGCLGDQQAALVGQRCLEPGTVKNTYGTGCFMLYNTGEKPVFSKHGLLSTVGYKFGSSPAVYALEGSVAVAGAAISWLKDNLGLIKEPKEISELASQVPDTAGIFFVPAFAGLFAPYWRDDARGCIIGLTQYTTKHHICRATLEAICFQSKEIIDAMNLDSGQSISCLKVDGGLTNSSLLLQIQSDLLGATVSKSILFIKNRQ